MIKCNVQALETPDVLFTPQPYSCLLLCFLICQPPFFKCLGNLLAPKENRESRTNAVPWAGTIVPHLPTQRLPVGTSSCCGKATCCLDTVPTILQPSQLEILYSTSISSGGFLAYLDSNSSLDFIVLWTSLGILPGHLEVLGLCEPLLQGQ